MHHRFAPRLAFLLMALLSSSVAAVTSCRSPPSLPESQTLRTDWRNTETTTDFYALSLSWSPEYCAVDPVSALLVALIANVLPEEVQQIREAGFDGLIGKPLSFEHFAEQLQQLLDGQPAWQTR